MRFSLDGRSRATSAEDGVVELWDVETGAPRWRGPGASAARPAEHKLAVATPAMAIATRASAN